MIDPDGFAVDERRRLDANERAVPEVLGKAGLIVSLKAAESDQGSALSRRLTQLTE